MTSKRAEDRTLRSEAVLDSIESALEEIWEGDDDKDVMSLPEELRDPMQVMLRGRELLKEGLRFVAAGSVGQQVYDDEFRMAARNGGVIPDRVLSRMRSEREAAEAQIGLVFDESD